MLLHMCNKHAVSLLMYLHHQLKPNTQNYMNLNYYYLLSNIDIISIVGLYHAVVAALHAGQLLCTSGPTDGISMEVSSVIPAMLRDP